MLTCRYVGFMPATPQKAAGRVIDPPVCVPSAPRHMPQATAAADPLDEPPGVRSRFQGLRVTGGSIQANGVETVLPRMIAPASRRRATMTSVRVGRSWRPEPSLARQAVAGRQSLDVNDVLDADRDAVQRSAAVAGLQLFIKVPRLRFRALPVDEHPGPHRRLHLVDPVEARLEDVQAGDLAGAQPAGGAHDRLMLFRKEPHRLPFRGLRGLDQHLLENLVEPPCLAKSWRNSVRLLSSNWRSTTPSMPSGPHDCPARK